MKANDANQRKRKRGVNNKKKLIKEVTACNNKSMQKTKEHKIHITKITKENKRSGRTKEIRQSPAKGEPCEKNKNTKV